MRNPSEAASIGFTADIRPLFRTRDITAMRNFGGFDLSVYEDVVANAGAISAKLKIDMPCDALWPPERIELFDRWIAGGMLP